MTLSEAVGWLVIAAIALLVWLGRRAGMRARAAADARAYSAGWNAATAAARSQSHATASGGSVSLVVGSPGAELGPNVVVGSAPAIDTTTDDAASLDAPADYDDHDVYDSAAAAYHAYRHSGDPLGLGSSRVWSDSGDVASTRSRHLRGRFAGDSGLTDDA